MKCGEYIRAPRGYGGGKLLGLLRLILVRVLFGLLVVGFMYALIIIIIHLMHQKMHIYNKTHVLLSTLCYMFRRLLLHIEEELYRMLKTFVTLFGYRS